MQRSSDYSVSTITTDKTRVGSVSLPKQFIHRIHNLRVGDSLKSRLARGGTWLGSANALEQTFRLLRNMILTRLLAPEAFGLMAIVLAVNTAFESFTEIGISQAIVQNPKGHEKTYLNGAFVLSFIRSIGLFLIAFFAAPFIAQFYGNPDLVLLMRVAFLSILFKGAMSPHAYVAVKQLNFKRWVFINNGGGIIGIFVAISLAFIMRDVWALVIGFTVEALFRLLLSYCICPFLPGVKFKEESLRALFKYAQGMLGLPILTFIFMRTDIFVLGKLVNQSDLGLYAMAMTLAYIPTRLVTQLFGQILMPAFSEIQFDMDRVNAAFLKITSVIVFLCLPLWIFAVLYGNNLLHIVYGTEYAKAALPFAIIFGTSTLQVSGSPITALFFSIGLPQLNRLFTLVRAILVLALIYPAVKWFGLVGAASAGFIAMSVAYIFQIMKLRKIIGLNVFLYNKIFMRGFMTSLLIPMLWFLSNNLMTLHTMSNLMWGFIGCFLTYAMVLWGNRKSLSKI